MNRAGLRFALIFLACLAAFSVILHLDIVDARFTVPMTTLVARASSATLNLLGTDTHVDGTVLSGEGGFAVNILNGCNGVYISAILVSAVLAFPATWRQRLAGLAVGIAGIQVVNLVRIVSLYLIGMKRPDLFNSFHLYVWQTGVIVVSMAIWIGWAEVVARRPAR